MLDCVSALDQNEPEPGNHWPPSKTTRAIYFHKSNLNVGNQNIVPSLCPEVLPSRLQGIKIVGPAQSALQSFQFVDSTAHHCQRYTLLDTFPISHSRSIDELGGLTLACRTYHLVPIQCLNQSYIEMVSLSIAFLGPQIITILDWFSCGHPR